MTQLEDLTPYSQLMLLMAVKHRGPFTESEIIDKCKEWERVNGEPTAESVRYFAQNDHDLAFALETHSWEIK